MKKNKTTNAKRNHHTPVFRPAFRPAFLLQAIIASLSAGCFGIACAEDAGQLKEIDVTADMPGYWGDSADSTSKTATPLKDLPASIQVVPNQVLRDRGVTRTNQLLENVSGVLAESSYGGNGATFFNIRGFSESNGLRDGFRNFGYYAFRDVQNIEQVEVFKGPAGALYGGVGAVGGYINTVSKRPLKNNVGELGITADSNGLVRKSIDINRVLDNDVSVRLNGAVDQSATFRDNGGYDSWSIAPSVSWDNRQGTSLTLLTEFNHLNRHGFDLGIPAVANYQALSRTRYYGLANGVYPGVAGDYGKNDTQSATLLFEHALNEDWKLRMAANYTYAHQRSTQTFPDSTVAAGNLLDYAVYSGADEASKQYAVQTELSGSFSAGGFRHSLLTGIDYGYLEQGGRSSTVSTITVDLLNPNYVSALTPAGSTSSHQGQGKDFGVYVQDMIDLAPQWKLLAALRADRFINRALVSDVETSGNRQTVFSPRAGLVWQPTDRLTIFTDWSRSHSPNVGHSANENTFDAEIAEQTELGIRHELMKDALHATLAIFDLKRSNILTTDPNDSTRQILSGKQESRGIEFDLVGTVTPDWKVIASYTYTNAVVKSDLVFPVGDHLSNVPRHHASIWNSYGFNAIPGFSAGIGVYYIGEREANLPNTFKLPGYVRTDAALTYQRNAWRTQLNIFNMFNRKYYTGGSAGVFNYTLDPSPPLTAQLTITYRF